jgi:hypothetical protein
MKTMKANLFKNITFRIAGMLLFSACAVAASGNNYVPDDSLKNSQVIPEKKPEERSFKMTTLTFGGNGVQFTKVLDQFTVMAGGRGSATFNNRYTIGGGGWGMTKGVEIESETSGVYPFLKMGYGGVDLGYLLFPGEKLTLGTKLLMGGGAAFIETIPETQDTDFQMFPVLEPTVYSQIALGKMFKFELGASYRFVGKTDLPGITSADLGGLSFYVGFLVKACDCNQ